MFQKFIRAGNEYTTKEKHIPAPYIRKSFDLDFVPDKASVYICTPGFYTIYINGKDITKGFLAPYISNPDDLVCYDEYDISDYMQNGKNCIAFVLGNGFANQTVDEWDFSKASFRAPLCASVYLKAEKNGAEFVLEADESFKTHPSPIIYDMYRDGTHYDARLEVDGWNLPDFDDGEWNNVLIADSPKGEIVKCTAHPIKTQYELKPVKIALQEKFCFFRDFKESYIEKGFMYDFGVNRAGVCRLKIKGKEGQKIIIRHGETITEDGNFCVNSVVLPRADFMDRMHLFQTDVYILKGDEEEIFIPPFTYHGFRYVLVEGITEEQATEDLLTYMVFNSDVKRRAYFECSDETVNKLYDMAIASDLSNLHYFPTDCPQREKNGWTGDMSASAEQYSLHFDYADTMKLWLKSLEYAQKEDGCLPGIVPTTGIFYDWGNGPVWDSACVNVPYFIYKYDGRRDVLEKAAPIIAKYLQYVATRRDEKGFVTFGLGDWSQAGSLLEEGIDTPLAVTGTGTVYDMARKSAFIFDVLGMREEKEFAEKLAFDARKSIREHLIDYETMTVSGNCQTAQAFFISLGIFEENERERAYSRLVELIEEKGRHLHCGVVGLRHIIEVLFTYGDADLALEAMCKKTSPSYGWLIEQGGTSLFEILEETEINKSQNHHFLGDYIRVFVSYMLGIKVNPYLRNINEIVISPIIPDGINSAKGSYTAEKGTVFAEWRKNGEKIEFIIKNEGCLKVSFEYMGKKFIVGNNEKKQIVM